jgi:hypothetical protein
MNTARSCLLGLGLTFAWSVGILAQADRFELGAHVASVASDQFDTRDTGFGGRFSWNPIPLVGLESEISLYPGEFPASGAFSRARVEGLFGATVGPRLASVRPFARFAAGFLNFRPAAAQFACILIYPPPLSCTLGAGRTLPAFELGGGLAFFPSSPTFVRFEIGDRALKYPGPAFDNKRTAHDSAFFGHDIRVAAGAGWRF